MDNELRDLAIRPARAEDAGAITRIHGDAIRGTPAVADHYDAEAIAVWSRDSDTEERREWIARAIAGGHHLYIVAEANAEVVGFGSVASDQGELRAVYVNPDHGSRGIGGLLLERLEKAAIAAGCRHLWLDASLNAEAFYAFHGYVSIGRRSHTFRSGGEIACVRMEKELNESPAQRTE